MSCRDTRRRYTAAGPWLEAWLCLFVLAMWPPAKRPISHTGGRREQPRKLPSSYRWLSASNLLARPGQQTLMEARADRRCGIAVLRTDTSGAKMELYSIGHLGRAQFVAAGLVWRTRAGRKFIALVDSAAMVTGGSQSAASTTSPFRRLPSLLIC
jgi:hypothetical protein